MLVISLYLFLQLKPWNKICAVALRCRYQGYARQVLQGRRLSGSKLHCQGGQASKPVPVKRSYWAMLPKAFYRNNVMILPSLGSVHPVFSSLSFSSFDKGAQFDPSLLYCLYVRLVTCKQMLPENLLPLSIIRTYYLLCMETKHLEIDGWPRKKLVIVHFYACCKFSLKLNCNFKLQKWLIVDKCTINEINWLLINLIEGQIWTGRPLVLKRYRDEICS